VKLELISFKLCPFAQRSLITLLHQELEHQVTYIDISDPPPWFLDISPFGQVPVLRLDDGPVIFESAVINEFINEVAAGPSMLPEEPLKRALNRAWTEFGSSCLGDVYAMVNAKDEKAFEEAREELHDKFERLEEVLENAPFFNGDHLALIDAAYAPLLQRLGFLNELTPVYSPEEFPRIATWGQRLLALPEVQQSAVPELREMYLGMVKRMGGWLASKVPD
jgi:glutathione S-transferase